MKPGIPSRLKAVCFRTIDVDVEVDLNVDGDGDGDVVGSSATKLGQYGDELSMTDEGFGTRREWFVQPTTSPSPSPSTITITATATASSTIGGPVGIQTVRRSKGFTLLEVMLALAVLGVGLIALVGMITRDVGASYRAKLLSIATGLARSKMYDVEEELLHTGFQDTGEHMEGDFADDGQPKFKWSAEIEKVYLPEAGELQDEKNKDDNAHAVPGPTDTANQQSLLNLSGGSTTGALGASMVQLYFPLIRPVLENAIRRVTLTVKWPIGKNEETLQVVCFFTDTKPVDRAMGGLSGVDSSAGKAPATTNPTTPTTPGVKR